MARTIKAQTIDNLASITTNTDITDECKLLISKNGETSNVSIGTLKNVFGSGSSNNLNDGTASGITLDEYSPESYIKEYTSQPIDETEGNDYVSSELEIPEQSIAHCHIIGNVQNAGQGFIELQIKSKDDNWYTVCKQVATANASVYDSILCAHFKAYPGLKIRARLKNKSAFETAGSIIDLTLVRNNSPFGTLSRSYTMTIGTAKQTDDSYVSNIIKFTEADGLVNVDGYFSLSKTLNPAKDKTTGNVYLQYKAADSSSNWINLTHRHVDAAAPYHYDFGQFYVQKDSSIRLVSNSVPHKDGAKQPYASCTGIVKYDAIVREGAHIENAGLSTMTEISAMLNGSNVNTFTFNINNGADTETGNMVIFSNVAHTTPMHIEWQAGNIENYTFETDNVIEHKYGYINNPLTGTYTVRMEDSITMFGYSSNAAVVPNPAKTAKADKYAIAQFSNTLIDMSFASSVTSIADYAFYECANLGQARFPATVKVFSGNQTFFHNSNNALMKLSAVTFEGTDTSCNVMTQTFRDCQNLLSINLENLNVREIGEYAFLRTGILSANIRNGCVSIASGAFQGTKNLSVVVIPTSVSAINSAAFKSSHFTDKIGDVYIKLSGDNSSYLHNNQIIQTSYVRNEIQANLKTNAKIANIAQMKGKKAYILDKDNKFIHDENSTNKYYYTIVATNDEVSVE